MSLAGAMRSAFRSAFGSVFRSAFGGLRSPQASRGAGPGSMPLPAGSVAPVVAGVLPDGSAADADTANGRASLLFLTSECRECKDAWRRGVAGSAGTVIVTPGPETESSRRVAKLSGGLSEGPSGGLPGGPSGGPSPERAIKVVMSSAAWHAYGVTKAPWLVEIEAGTIVRTGPFAA